MVHPARNALACTAFAGLIFDRNGRPRFTVMTFVRHGRYGGGASAEISTVTARRLASGAS